MFNSLLLKTGTGRPSVCRRSGKWRLSPRKPALDEVSGNGKRPGRYSGNILTVFCADYPRSAPAPLDCNAYFVPDEAVFAALRLAVMRGVEVRILLPARRDQYMVFQASTLYAHDAIRAGIQIFRYTP